jgi:hypothetical protein
MKRHKKKADNRKSETKPRKARAIDPIFAAIDAWRRADAARVPVDGDIPDDLADKFDEAHLAVIRTRPTTPTGLAALTGWVREWANWLRDNASELYAKDFCAIAAAIDDATRGMSGLEPNPEPVPAAHPDKAVLHYVASWKAAQAELNLIWANSEKETLFCTISDDTLILQKEPIDSAYAKIGEAKNSLVSCEPTTTLAAHVLLEAAIDILRARELDPEGALGEGPAMNFLMTVAHALAYRDIQLTKKDAA